MITFMNLASSTLPYLGSGRISRLGTSRRRGISITFQFASAGPAVVSASRPWEPSGFPLTRPTAGHYARLPCLRRRAPNKICLGLLRALGAVLGAGLLAVLDALLFLCVF